MSGAETIERALELAADGKHRSLEDIRRTLRREQRENIDEHLAGASIKAQIKMLILKANDEV